MAISKEEGQRLNRMSTLQRLTELLDHPVKYKDILRNNLNVLFPIAEEQAAFWEKTSNQIKRKYPNLKDDDSSLAYVEQEALEWNKIARRCCLEVLKIEPNKAMRVKWGVAFLVGYVFINDSHGRICNIHRQVTSSLQGCSRLIQGWNRPEDPTAGTGTQGWMFPFHSYERI
jgi:hypothetical protein